MPADAPLETIRTVSFRYLGYEITVSKTVQISIYDLGSNDTESIH